jgi:MTH538 TIR-like domain (DUF1863)
MPDAAPRYSAFISYRHVPPDRDVARWLHGALETYRVPRAVLQGGASARLGRVFRDEEELAASPDLSARIDAALSRADALVVLCSPRTPASRWVDAEVRRFAVGADGASGVSRIFALLLEGEPNESFPAALAELGREPLAADLRPLPGESRREARRRALLKLVAGLLGVEYDTLRQRDDERRRRRLVWTATAASIGLVAFAGLATVATVQWQRAEAALVVAQARNLAGQAQLALSEASSPDSAALASGEVGVRPDVQRSALLALESLALRPEPTADRVLRDALTVIARDRLTFTLRDAERLVALQRPIDSLPLPTVTRVAVDTSAAATDAAFEEPPLPDGDELARSADGRWVLRRSEEGLGGWIVASVRLQRTNATGGVVLPHEWYLRAARFSADGRWLTTVTGDVSLDAAEPSATALVGNTVRVWDVDRGIEVTRVSLAATGGIESLRIDGRGEWLVTVSRDDTGEAPRAGRRVRLWPLAPPLLRATACALLTRNLSASEWATYVGAGARRDTCAGLPVASE